MSKAEIRREMAAIRDQLCAEDIESKSACILYRLTELEEYKNASMILTYVNFRSEVCTKGLIQKALSEGKLVTVPVCLPGGKRLLPCEISSLEDLVPGTWGILEPPEHARKVVDAQKIDLVVVPGLAFDRRFNRLGYGAGYYDRFLPRLRENAAKIGICYDFQLTDLLPADPFDVPMNGIVTEKTVLQNI